jgi:hypothetical protein
LQEIIKENNATVRVLTYLRYQGIRKAFDATEKYDQIIILERAFWQ